MTPTDEQLIRLGRTVAGSSVVVAIGGLVVAAAVGRWEVAWEVLAPVNALVGVGFGALAWTVLPKQPRNGSVWAYTFAAFFGGLFSACLAILVLSAPTSLLDDVSDLAMIPADLPWPAAIAAGVMVTFWLPCLFLPLTLGLLLFPDGRLPSPSWRWVGWYQALTLTLAVIGSLVLNNRWSTYEVTSVTGTFGTIVEVVIVLAQLGAAFGVAALVARYRRGDTMVRRQIRWIASGGALLVIGTAAIFVIRGGLAGPSDSTAENLLNLVPLGVLIGSFWVAITRYRLYEIDAIISKSVTYIGLAVVIVGLYAAVVVVPLLIIGVPDEGGPGLVLPIVASAMVAVLFEPIRSRLQRAANRLVYGDRASPHEVLSQVTSSLPAAAAGDGTGDLAQLIARGTGADRAIVWVASGEMLQASGVFPDTGEAAVAPVAPDGLVDDEFTESRPVLHRGELFGALTIVKPQNDPWTPADRQLLSDVAAGSGLLLRNIGLNRQLAQRAADVRASRRRLIAAQDAERHRLERDLHDGAQQQVVALKVKLGIARTIAEREDADEIAARATTLAEETQQAVDALRAVAHGIYPPLLESEGLASALRAVERTSPIGLDLSVEAVGRYGREVEGTAYFCVLETLERARMAGASGARVAIAAPAGELVLRLDIDDRIPALDLTTVTDRVDAYGGTITAERGPSGETVITTVLPANEIAMEPA
jgi:signal transduction histidine kinase